ncbi:MAG: PAS domain S-box protein [Geothrix sp.]|nr:PAS domain S-box protein [Geothrix sp.]
MPFDLDQICRQVVTQAADAIIYADDQGLIRLWNAGAERIFGHPEAEALGQSLDIIIPENQRKRHWDGYGRTLATGVTRYGADSLLSVPAIRKDGSRVSVEFTILPFHGEGGKIVGMAAIMRDVTTRFEELKALRKLAAGAP